MNAETKKFFDERAVKATASLQGAVKPLADAVDLLRGNPAMMMAGDESIHDTIDGLHSELLSVPWELTWNDGRSGRRNEHGE